MRDIREDKHAGKIDGASISATDQAIIISGVDSNGNAQFIQVGTDGTIPTSPGANTSVGTGSKTVTTAGTRVQLSSSSVPCKKVIIQSLFANTGNTYIGDINVSSTVGLLLYPGGATSFVLTPNNLNLLYIDSAVNGEGVSYYYEN